MTPVITAAIIGGICTIIAAVVGAMIGKSDFLDRLLRKKSMPTFVGSRWESKWVDTKDGKTRERKEYFDFTKQRGNKVYGIITSDEYPNMKWNIEGDYNDRFLRLLWTPSRESTNQFFIDYGCYFFERKGDGSFIGYAVGFDNESNKIEVGKHELTIV